MTTALDGIVFGEGNKEAFELVMSSMEKHDEPVRLALYGPVGTGKTTLLKTLAEDKNTSSAQQVAFCHAAELMVAVNFDVEDEYYERLGSAKVLFLDGFEDFFAKNADPTIGVLLLAERRRLGLDTVVVSNVPFGDFDLSSFNGELDSYRYISVSPLSASEREAFVAVMQVLFGKGSSEAPRLDEDATAFLANEFSTDLNDVKHAVMYLVTAADLPSNTLVDIDMVKRLLGAE